ncbi:PRC-barrel domain containing protein [Streptomyces sp. NBC_01214]|uniref:PRC-barrel domain containing protein n=2 Tax=Streptomyces TaxID=1883 RepID=UPI00207A6632|nr:MULTISPECIES: PRC-barrel domain containing protein [Streptomyces]MCM9077951.1 PRC-barrel domain containing protein [Streptomyces spororaveus]MCX4803273.1 PRC-barrel domain containing protein [Streptomyces sp. NBC_01214]WSC76129.1 PRC-barrel domain containing protein [Streptomyces virginiae]
MSSVWMYAQDSGYTSRHSLVGFTVEAADGVIGHVDRQQDQPGMQHLVVDTGAWVFGQSVLIPAGAITVIDTEAQTVKVAPSREQIRVAPRFTTDSETADHRYLSAVGNY